MNSEEKRNILKLIKSHTENDDDSFRNVAYKIAQNFDEAGDEIIADYIFTLLSGPVSFVPLETLYSPKK